MDMYITHYETAATNNVELMDDAFYPQRVHWFPDTYARVGTGMVHAAHALVGKVVNARLAAYLKDRPVSGKTGFILAGGSQSWGSGTLKNPNKTRLTYKYKMPTLALTQIYAGRLAQGLGRFDHVAVDASACASSLKAMFDAQNLIRFYGFDRVVIVAAEDAVCDFVLEFFGELGVSKKPDDPTMPSAFDSTNNGFYVGQGACAVVVESERACKTTPKAVFRGAYVAAEESTNAVGQREDGQGFVRAIQGAMDAAGCTASQIKVVKTHGTGTQSNNMAERTALLSTIPEFVATSYKPRIGHTLAASGLLETCLLLDDMAKGTVPEILNRTEPDSTFLSAPVSTPDGLILSLAAGMGNVYAASIFDRSV